MSNKSNKIDVNWLSQQIGSPSIYNIVHKIIALINNGKITVGASLPSIRILAKALNLSSTTVATALNELKARNIIRSKQGVGCVVIDNPATVFPRCFATEPFCSELGKLLDLSKTYPDRALLPSLKRALIYAVNKTEANNNECMPIIPELQEALSVNWPYPAKSFMAVNNSFEIIANLITLFAQPNAYIAIENPAPVNELDKLRRRNVRLIAVERDNEGPIIASLVNALAKKPVLFIYQPREHNVTGKNVSRKRMTEMAELFKIHSQTTLIIEHDIIGNLSTYPAYSLGKYLPKQVFHIRPYLKIYSSDLCFVTASGPKEIVQQLYHYRLCNLGWNSQLLQYALAYLLKDQNTAIKIKQAQEIYAQRYSALLEALKARRICLHNRMGARLSLWLPVHSESQVLAHLRSKGIIACGGSHFMVKPVIDDRKQYVRIMTSQLSTPELINQVADGIIYALTAPYTKSVINGGVAEKSAS